MTTDSRRFRRRAAWGFGLFVVAVTVAALSGLPDAMALGLRTNLALALGLLGLSVWWGVSVYSTRGTPGRASAWFGLAGALVGAAAASGLVLGAFRWIPPSLGYRALGLFALETPLWAMALLAWPAPRRPTGARRGLAALDALTLLLVGGLLFWDFLIRPSGEIPPTGLGRLALLSWALVLVSLGAAALRGSRPEHRTAFHLLSLSLGATVAGNYLVAMIPELPARLLVVSGLITLLLRIGAAETLLSPPASATTLLSPMRNGVPWFVAGSSALILLHLGLRRPATGGFPLLSGVVVVTLLLLARQSLARRAPP